VNKQQSTIIQQQQPFYGPLSGTTRVRRYQKKLHPPTILIIIQSLSTSSIYYDPSRPPCSNYVLGNLFAQPLSLSMSTVIQVSKLECGPMPNLMVALLNIGGTLCSTPQSLADAHY